MKLVFVTHTMYPDFIGGREHHVHHLARAFAKEHEVVVIGGAKVSSAVEEVVDGYRRIRLPTISVTLSRNPLQVYRVIPRLRACLQKERPDLVHAFEYGSDSTYVAYAYARKRGCPFFLTIYGYVLKHPLLGMCKWIYDLCIGRRILEQAAGVFCVSKTQYDEVRAITSKPFFKGTLMIQENGIMCSDFVGQDPSVQPLGEGDAPLSILSASRIIPRKNIKTLILAVHEVVRQRGFLNVRLSIAGPDCGEKKSLQELIDALDLHDHVALTGELSYGEIRSLMCRHEVFVLLSLYEGMPLSVLEAMACGRAVIFSDCAVGRKMIRDNVDGVLVDPADIKAIADVIIQLGSDRRKCTALGQQAQMKVLQFDSHAERKTIEGHYRKAFNANGN
ncbi:MAG: glycosyltransferase family 4 protein [Candidatus Omnitrophica bacterium]|nr:glycosyltransferase family 4 protein [Candidatus Omnitrophota bacterium]